jgi:Mg2+/Co2+ transporter CorB
MIAQWTIAQDGLVLSAILVLLLLASFFAGSVAALTTFSRARMQRLEKAGNRAAARANALLQDRDRVAGALLFGAGLVRSGACVLAAALFFLHFEWIGLAYAAAVMAVVIVVFTEVLPKALAAHAADRVMLFAARPMTWIVWSFNPLVAATAGSMRAILRRAGVADIAQRPVFSVRDELRVIEDFLRREGGGEKQYRDMLGGVLGLSDLQVSDVMIHRTEMITVCVDEPPAEAIKAILDAPVTRIPLWSDKPENIVGILHVKNLVKTLQAANGDMSKIDLVAVARPPWFVPMFRPLTEQLKAFRRRKTPFALVVDEYGETMGLVTLEDIIEEIVGDISDEYDVDVPGVRPQPDGSVTVEGAVSVRDLNRAMDWNLPDEEATTIAGLVIHEARSIPDAGQSFTFHGFRFRVVRKERNRITAVRITPLAFAG